MRNYLRFNPSSAYSLLIGFMLLLHPLSRFSHSLFFSGKKDLNSDPPAFAENPPDITIDCLADLPPATPLLATDDNDPSFPKNIAPVDNPPVGMLDPCAGGLIKRTWTAADLDGNTTVIEQLITVSPDQEGPVVTLPPTNDTVPCGQDDFNNWLNTLRLRLSLVGNGVSDACGSVITLDFQPKNLPPRMGLCETRVITFTLADGCGNTTEWQASYSTSDREKPILNGVPASLTLTCRDGVPTAPAVTATDNCLGAIPVTFSETTEPAADCPDFNFTITRRWSAADQCGNEAVAIQTITVRDEQGPTFTTPGNKTLTCDQDPDDLQLTGQVTDLDDACDPAPSIEFSDFIVRQDCPNTYVIQRNWTATDACGNVAISTQIIEVVDDEAPSFVVPPDVTVGCDQVNDPEITGRPTRVRDNCDAGPTVRIDEETIIGGGGPCPNQYEIRRVWRVEDVCGNATEKTQKIFVTDQRPPSFVQPPANLELTCSGGLDLTAAFNQWIEEHGGATARDNCSATADLKWFAFKAGTTNPASLPDLNCPAAEGALRLAEIDFVVEDECGNREIAKATFTLVDDTAPSIQACREEEVISTDPGECTGTFRFRIPQVEDNCTAGLVMGSLNAQAPISSNAAPGQEGEVPVGPVVLRFSTAALLPLNISGDATLKIRLVNADAEEANEFFNILGENGAALGRTALANQQCGNSETVLLLSQAQVETWGADGEITLRLEPNIPANQPGRFAINALCNPAGRVEADLSFNQLSFPGLSFAYRVGQGAATPMNPAQVSSVSLPQGVHLLTYLVTDCAGNADSCSFFVRVVDREAPQLSCPTDIQVSTDSGSCQASVILPLPPAVADNCAALNRFSQNTPSSEAAARLIFRRDPNLNDYLAQDKVLSFTNVAANALGAATLRLDFQGDFTGTGAFVRILGEDGNELGRTSLGAANCSTPGQINLTIPRNTFNTWAADGKIDIRVEVNDIPVPPGVKGDGINPCNESEVTADGDDDGVSFIRGSLEYDNIRPSYYAEGATTIPLSQVPLPGANPTHTFNQGETTVYYILPDLAGNVDTCSFRVVVRDQELPVARCQATTLFINPAGIGEELIDARAIDAGSRDNCGIDSIMVFPRTFNCNQAGATVQVTLRVVDQSGNEATCSTPVRLETLKPQPTATSGICGNDTLYLFANPPKAEGGIVFTYKWTGPRGFVSDQENPVRPKVTSQDAGSYVVEITGISNCKATGVVEVAVEDLPLTPQLLTDVDICVSEDIVLTSSVVPVGAAIYRWYRGVPPSGTLIATTSAPTHTISAPHPEGSRLYYLTIEAQGCISAPSAPVTIQITQVPQAVVNESQITVCAGQDIRLGTPVSGSGIGYQWTGPDGFTSSNQFPAVISPATSAKAGVYKLVLIKNGCSSAEATVIVNVLPRPAQPQLSSTGPTCEGREVTLTTNIPRGSVYRWISPSLQEFITTTNSLVIPAAGQEVRGPWRVSVSEFGCTSELSQPTELVVFSNPPAAAAVSQNIVCEGDKFQLFGSPTIGNAIYRWTGPGGYNSATQNPTLNNVTKAQEGTYRLTISTAEGCSGTASVTVGVQRSAVITALSNDAPECLSGPTDIRLAASVFPPDPGTYRYNWTGPGGFSSTDSTAVVRNASVANNGNYQLIVTTADGCISAPAITTVAVANPPAAPAVPRISALTPAPFCESRAIQLQTDVYTGVSVTYNWRTPRGVISTSAPALDIPAIRVEDSGDYSLYVTVDGCDSRESGRLNIPVGQTPVVSVLTNSPVCEGETVELRTQVIPGATYSWVGPGFTSPLANPDIDQATPSRHDGTYALRVTLNGCASDLVTTEVRVLPAPTQPVLSNNGPLCTGSAGAELVLTIDDRTATPGATYSWFDPSGLLVSDTTALSIRLTDLGRYGNANVNFSAQARLNGCPSVLSIPTTVQLNTIPDSRAFAGNDFGACEGLLTELKASAPSQGSGRWTQVGGDPAGVVIVNPDQPITAVTGLQGGQSYSFRWALSNGACRNYSTDDVTVEVTESEVVDGGQDISVCENEEVVLSASPVQTSRASWKQTEVQARLGVKIESPTKSQTLISGLEAGNLYSFFWTVEGGCGEIIDEVFVLVSDPNPFAGIDLSVCNDQGIAQLQGDEPTEGSRGRWSSPNPNISFSDPSNPDAVAEGLEPGPNVFVWTIDEAICGDDSRDSVVITYKLNPIARPDTVRVPFGRSVEFSALGNDFLPLGTVPEIVEQPRRGTVELKEDGRFVYTSKADFIGVESMAYRLCSEACDCSTARIFFEVGNDAVCEVPTIFTPNNDGVNDFFVVPCLLDLDKYPQSQVVLFNRWGDEVYRSQRPYQNDWRGTFNGEELPAGTYFYLIDLGNGSEPINGFIVITR